MLNRNREICPSCRTPIDPSTGLCPTCGWSEAKAKAFARVIWIGIATGAVILAIAMYLLQFLVPA